MKPPLKWVLILVFPALFACGGKLGDDPSRPPAEPPARPPVSHTVLPVPKKKITRKKPTELPPAKSDTAFFVLDKRLAMRGVDNKRGRQRWSFYSKEEGGEWEFLQQTDWLDYMHLTELEKPNYTDFNQDGVKDILVYAGYSRGMPMYDLFMEDLGYPERRAFYHVRGACVPRLIYHPGSGLFEGIYVHGRGYSFVDFEIKGDSMVELGGTRVRDDGEWAKWEQYRVDERGHSTTIKGDSILTGNERLARYGGRIFE